MIGFFGRNLILQPGAFRLLLAMLVVVSHMSRLEVGRLAVILFFVLSGYWVTAVFDRDYDRRAWPFLVSRAMRLAPVYSVCLVGAAAARNLPLGFGNFALLGVATSGSDPTGVAWSLDIELQFYLLLPLLLRAADRLGSPLLALHGIALTLAGWWLAEAEAIRTVGQHLPAFVVGIVLARTRWQPERRTALMSAAAFVAVTVVLGLTAFGRVQLDKLAPDLIDLDLFAMLWAAPLIPYVAHSLHLRSTKADRMLGDWSYPLYLVHVAVLAFVLPAFPGIAGKLVAFALSMALTLLLYFGVDRPAEKWRKQVFARWQRQWRSAEAGAERLREVA